METSAQKPGMRLKRGRKTGGMRTAFDILLNVAVIIILVFVVRSYFIAPFQVYGPSMCDTLNFVEGECDHGFGEYLIVNKFGYQNFFGWQVGLPERGDIVVFHPQAENKEFYIKRIIGTPGDTVKIQNGEVFILKPEGTAYVQLNEPYLNENNKGATYPLNGSTIKTFQVPEGRYFLLGDNRKESTDGRTCFEPPLSTDCSGDKYFLPLNQVEGKAWIVLWPLKNIRMMPDLKIILP